MGLQPPRFDSARCGGIVNNRPAAVIEHLVGKARFVQAVLEGNPQQCSVRRRVLWQAGQVTQPSAGQSQRPAPSPFEIDTLETAGYPRTGGDYEHTFPFGAQQFHCLS